jgi:hypothetical protein
MKVIFLDHDGVICLATEWGGRFDKNEGCVDARFDDFDDDAIKVLNEIVDETDCEIVISSDWRHHATLEELQELYKVRDIKKSPIGVTGLIQSFKLEESRVEEIQNFLSSHPEIEKWVAVDDMDLSTLGNFVQTPNSREGIKQTGIKEKIIKFLV